MFISTCKFACNQCGYMLNKKTSFKHHNKICSWKVKKTQWKIFALIVKGAKFFLYQQRLNFKSDGSWFFIQSFSEAVKISDDLGFPGPQNKWIPAVYLLNYQAFQIMDTMFCFIKVFTWRLLQNFSHDIISVFWESFLKFPLSFSIILTVGVKNDQSINPLIDRSINNL